MARFVLIFTDAVVDEKSVVTMETRMGARDEAEVNGPITPACACGVIAAVAVEEPEVAAALLTKVTQMSGMVFPALVPIIGVREPASEPVEQQKAS